MRDIIGTGRNCDICSIFLDVYVYDDEGVLSVEFGEASRVWDGGLVRIRYTDFNKHGCWFCTNYDIQPKFVCSECYQKYGGKYE